MDSLLETTLAIAFSHYEKIWPNNSLPEFKPVGYRKYVDDIFVFFKSKNHLLSFARYMNIRHQN